MANVCECGCGRSLEGRRAGTRFARTACRVSAHRARKAEAARVGETTPTQPEVEDTPSTGAPAGLVAGLLRWGARPEAAEDLMRRAAADNPEDLDSWFQGMTQEHPAYFQPSTGSSATTTKRTGPPVPMAWHMDPETFGMHAEEIASGRIR